MLDRQHDELRPTPAPIINPIHAYSHAATGCESITGGAFVPNGAWPGYDGTYMFADYICQKIFTLSNVCGSWSATTFASNLGGVTDLQFVGNELWYGSYNGSVHRIIPPSPPAAGAASRFVPITPVRKLDTRIGIGGPAAIVPAGGTRTVSLGPEVPAGAVAAAVNVTITGALGAGYVTAWPADKPQPGTSTLNVTRAGQTVPNAALIAVSPSQTINLFSSAGGHLIVDVSGYYVASGAATAGRFQSLAPQRILDTRVGIGAPIGRVNGLLNLQVAGQGGVPASGASAVAMVLTGTDAVGGGFATAWPAGQALPNASVLNLAPGDTRANLVVVPIGAGGKVSLQTSLGMHLIADVAGWFTNANQPASISGLFVPVTPTRLLDTRQPGQVMPPLPRDVPCTVGMSWALPANAARGGGQPDDGQRARLRLRHRLAGRHATAELVEHQHQPRR